MINPGYKISLSVGSDVVIFEASSPLDESRTAHYEGFNIMHLPTDIQSYKNTSSRTFGVTAKLVSRNADEASMNARNIDLIRSWILPGFGSSGATPPIVTLSAFNNRNINNVPCIIESYSIHYPDDVDWVFTGADPMPVIGSITVSLKEAWSPAQISTGTKDPNTGKIVYPWMMSISKGGKFMTGSNYNDNTSAGAGGVGGISPPLIDLSSSGNFAGIAANSYNGNLTTIASPTNSCLNYGITSSGLIQDNTVVSNPVNGYSLDTASQLVANNVTNTATQYNNLIYPANTYNRSTLPALGPTLL